MAVRAQEAALRIGNDPSIHDRPSEQRRTKHGRYRRRLRWREWANAADSEQRIVRLTCEMNSLNLCTPPGGRGCETPDVDQVWSVTTPELSAAIRTLHVGRAALN